jgi:hypothetical protein
MAVPTNTLQRAALIGVREDLIDKISNIDPTECPLMNNIGTATAKQTFHEWQTDSLVAANGTNAAIEGDDATNDVRPLTKRNGNYTQLSRKVVQVSDTADAVNKAGRAKEMAYQMAKMAPELRRDVETRLCGNYAAVPGAGGTAGQASGAVAMVRTNASRGTSGTAATLSGGTSGYINAVGTAGTLRSVTESMLKTAIQLAWSAGGKPKIALMSGTIKQTASTFAGIAQQRREVGNKAATIIGAADVYVSDFGDIAFVPSRFTSGRDVLIYDPTLWHTAYLQPMQDKPLAENGNSTRRLLWTEFTLRCDNELGNAVIADVTP